MSAPVRIVGIMLTKDEADAVPDVIPPLVQSLDALYYFAGDGRTGSAIDYVSPPGWARRVRVPEVPHADGLRHYLLEAARADKISDNDDRPMWVMPVQGDEIYHDNLREAVLWTHARGKVVMSCQVATFLIHESQREGWDWNQPLATRMTHYIWDFGEHCGFLDGPEVHYEPTDHMRAHPRGLREGPAAYDKLQIVRKHYPFRSPEQARARLADRLKATTQHPKGWQPHYHNYEKIFMSDAAAGRTVKKFDGTFPDAWYPEEWWRR